MIRAALPVSPLPVSPSALSDGDRFFAEPASGATASDVPSLIVALSTRSLVGVLIVVVWVGSGLVTALVMARRGHEMKTIAPIGVVVGPFLAGLARSNYIARESEVEPVVLAAGVPAPGSTALLIAILGDPGEAARVVPLLRSVEDDLREVVLARPVPFEVAQDTEWDRTKEDAAAALAEAARLLPGIQPRLLLVPGRAETAIARHAIDHDITNVICVGSDQVYEVLSADEELKARGIDVMKPDPAGDDIEWA